VVDVVVVVVDDDDVRERWKGKRKREVMTVESDVWSLDLIWFGSCGSRKRRVSVGE
jgi:hypothetical protein